MVNLVAKSLIREFDVKKNKADRVLADDSREAEESGSEDDDKVGTELWKVLREEVDNQPEVADESSDLDLDNDKGWIDEVALLEKEECHALEKDIRPIKLALIKVSDKRNTYIEAKPNFPAAKTGLQDNTLYHHCTPCVASNFE